MLKKKLSIILASLMVVASISTINVSNVKGVEVNSIEINETLEDGKYTMTNSIEYYKEGANEEQLEHGAQSARSVLSDETKVEIKDGKTIMTLYFNEKMYKFLQNIKVSLDGVDLQGVNNSEDKSISFEVPSIDSKVQLDMLVVVANHEVSFSVINNLNTLIKIQEEDLENGKDDNKEDSLETEKPEENTKPEENQKPDENDGGNSSNNNAESVKKIYTIENEVIHENAVGQSMARQYLNSVSTIEEVNGKYSITLTFTGVELMKNHEVYVNGNKVNHTVVSSTDKELKIKFTINSLDDSLKVNTFVAPMNRNVDFGVTLLKDTLKLVGTETSGSGSLNNGNNNSNNESNSNNNSSSGNGNSGSSSNSSATQESSKKEESKTEIIKGKLYSIKNEVYHENATGMAMARSYLSETSKVEEVNGVYYITLTFTGNEYLQNHQIYVNGSKVNVTKNVNGDETTVRFSISSLDDSIKAKIYIVPMGRDVEFDIKLLKDTLTFIKDYTIEVPKTSDNTSLSLVALLGLISIGSAGVLVAFRKKKTGEN